MKKAILTIILAIMLMGCNEEIARPTAWLITGPDTGQQTNPVSGRIGLINAEGMEFGLQSTWLYELKGQSYGAYAIQEIQLADPNLIGKQYIGAHAAIIDVDEEQNIYGFITGTSIPIQSKIDAVVEYQYNSYEQTGDSGQVMAGLKARF